MRKYRNCKITVNGMKFDSRREYNRYIELQLLERAGEIRELERQKKYILIPAMYETFERYGKNGQRLKDGRRCIEKECAYYADFAYIKDGEIVVEDAKGVRTKDYIIKRKLMLFIHGIKIKEV